MNRITLSGRAPNISNSEVEVEGSKTAFIDALATRGSISLAQHRAARTLALARREDRETMLRAISPNAQRHLEAMVLKGVTMRDHARSIQGYKNVARAEEWALQRLKASLDELARKLSGASYGEQPTIDESVKRS